jgi:putative hydrolase of the HAD superfamily
VRDAIADEVARCIRLWGGAGRAEAVLETCAPWREVEHLISVHPHVLDFLQRLKKAGKARILVTNAHQKALHLKMRKTRLGGYLDQVVSAHDLGLPKENPAFWTRLRQQVSFDPERTLFIDDSVPVLESARSYGIRNLLCILRPDTRQPQREVAGFPSVADFQPLNILF